MKITQFDDTYTQKVGAGETTLVSGSSGGSNSAFGGDVTGSAGSLSVVGLRQTVSLSSNMGDNTVGTVLTTIQSSPWLAAFAVSSNSGGGSFGSNATRVSASSFVGASANGSREDHRHDGIGTVTASSSNTLDRGTLNLRAGSNVALALTDSDGSGGFDTVTISASVTGGSSSSLDNWIEEIDCFAGSHGNTNWTTLNIDAAEAYAGDLESSGAQNDEIYWDVGLSGGTWDIDLMHFKGPNRGIYTVSIDGVSAGTIDGYVAVATRNNHGILTGVSISSGKRRLKLKMATKNASSSSFFGTVQHIQMRRTA